MHLCSFWLRIIVYKDSNASVENNLLDRCFHCKQNGRNSNISSALSFQNVLQKQIPRSQQWHFQTYKKTKTMIVCDFMYLCLVVFFLSVLLVYTFVPQHYSTILASYSTEVNLAAYSGTFNTTHTQYKPALCSHLKLWNAWRGDAWCLFVRVCEVEADSIRHIGKKKKRL